jgi:hypothetical protein
MAIGRTIVAFVVAASVAMLPAVGGAAVKVKSAELSASEPMHDCCPDPAQPCEKAVGDCTSMAVCALKCFSFAGTGLSEFLFPLIGVKRVLSLASNPLHSQTGSPPFRPPRV